MNRTSLKKMFVAGVAILGLTLCAAQANAGGWWGAAPTCCGSWDYCGTCAYVPSYSYAGWCGCGFHHRAGRWGCGFGYASSCCCDPCWTCCGTSAYWGTPVVSSCGCGAIVAPTAAPTDGAPQPAPAAPTPKSGGTPAAPLVPPVTTPIMPPVSPAPVTPDAGGIPHTSIEPTTGDSGVLTVWVPNEAKVTINGLLTKSTGSKRRFVSYGLRPGYTYKYEVKAEIVHEGKIHTETQTVSLTAGERGGVAFGFNIQPGPESEGLAQNE